MEVARGSTRTRGRDLVLLLFPAGQPETALHDGIVVKRTVVGEAAPAEQ